MQLHGRQWSKKEILARVGRLEQLGGLRRYRINGGPGDGMERIDLCTGAGLRIGICPSRGMDIVEAQFAGTSLCWQPSHGLVRADYYQDDRRGFLQNFCGGLLATCGLLNVGVPCEDKGEKLPLHGRFHQLAAQQVCASGAWEENEYAMKVSGEVIESSLFGHQLCLQRTIYARMGENRINIEDTVENTGCRPSPLMLLYHCNFGFPLLDEETSFLFPSSMVEPREAGAVSEGYDHWCPPLADIAERVFYHSGVRGREDNMAQATIRNPRFPMPGGSCPVELTLGWSADTLPELIEWHLPGSGEHVLGIEPTNCRVDGRVAERESGRLCVLQPGENRHFRLCLSIKAER